MNEFKVGDKVQIDPALVAGKLRVFRGVGTVRSVHDAATWCTVKWPDAEIEEYRAWELAVVTVMDWKTESADGLRSASTKELPRGRVAAWPAVRDYVFAGAAVFTLLSLKTGARYTFKVRAKKEDLEKARIREEHRRPDNSQSRPDLPEIDICYFVNLLRGQDNTKDFTYLGVLRRPGNFFITPASRVKREAAAYKALVWFLDQMRNERDVLGGQVEFWHNGRCGRCGRLLTVPKSVADGVGPECVKYTGRM